MTLGTFDLFHAGHVELLHECSRLAARDPWDIGMVIVGLNTDEFVARYKGRPPVIPWPQRAAVLQACRSVDVVVPNPVASHPQSWGIERQGPNIIAVGSDWEGKDYLGQLGVTQRWLESHEIKIRYIPRPDPPVISSTLIRERLARDLAS